MTGKEKLFKRAYEYHCKSKSDKYDLPTRRIYVTKCSTVVEDILAVYGYGEYCNYREYEWKKDHETFKDDEVIRKMTMEEQDSLFLMTVQYNKKYCGKE